MSQFISRWLSNEDKLMELFKEEKTASKKCLKSVYYTRDYALKLREDARKTSIAGGFA